MPNRFSLPPILALTLAVAGCDLFTKPGEPCTDALFPGIAVQVRDSVTGSSTGIGAIVVATDGAFVDTGSSVSGIYALAYERPGTYTVTVEQAGYLKWTNSGVVVTRGECHVSTVNIIARLQK
jgi:hypothetical protein